MLAGVLSTSMYVEEAGVINTEHLICVQRCGGLFEVEAPHSPAPGVVPGFSIRSSGSGCRGLCLGAPQLRGQPCVWVPPRCDDVSAHVPGCFPPLPRAQLALHLRLRPRIPRDVLPRRREAPALGRRTRRRASGLGAPSPLPGGDNASLLTVLRRVV